MASSTGGKMVPIKQWNLFLFYLFMYYCLHCLFIYVRAALQLDLPNIQAAGICLIKRRITTSSSHLGVNSSGDLHHALNSYCDVMTYWMTYRNLTTVMIIAKQVV